MPAFRKGDHPAIGLVAGEIEILHAERLRYAFFERLVHGPSGELRKNRPERIEVPVVVAPEGSRRMGVPLLLDGAHPWRFISGRMIDA